MLRRCGVAGYTLLFHLTNFFHVCRRQLRCVWGNLNSFRLRYTPLVNLRRNHEPAGGCKLATSTLNPMQANFSNFVFALKAAQQSFHASGSELLDHVVLCINFETQSCAGLMTWLVFRKSVISEKLAPTLETSVHIPIIRVRFFLKHFD